LLNLLRDYTFEHSQKLMDLFEKQPLHVLQVAIAFVRDYLVESSKFTPGFARELGQKIADRPEDPKVIGEIAGSFESIVRSMPQPASKLPLPGSHCKPIDL
jgi:hypothetical protein